MEQNQNNLNSFLKQEEKKYNKLIQNKSSDYESLANMRSSLSKDFDKYSDEDLIYLHELIKVKTVQTDKSTSGFLPVWAAICIALVSFIDDKNILALFGGGSLITVLIFIVHFYNAGIDRLGFYSMMSELIDKELNNRGHTF